jgi:hypothetical protein
MSGRLRSFDVLCGCLADGTAANTGDLRAALSDARLDWRRVIEAAAEHYVLPLLWCRLAERDLVAAVPPLVAELLADLHARNVARNERLRLQLIEIGAAVQAIGVQALLLKGSNALVAPAATRDARMMRRWPRCTPSATDRSPPPTAPASTIRRCTSRARWRRWSCTPLSASRHTSWPPPMPSRTPPPCCPA